VPIGLSPLGQVSRTVRDVDAAEAFYGTALGLRKLFRFGNLLFYDLAGVRLFDDPSLTTPAMVHAAIVARRGLRA